MSLPTGLSYTGYNGALTQLSGGGNGLSGSVISGRSNAMPQIARKLKGIGSLRLRVILRALAGGGSGQAISNGAYTRRVATNDSAAQGGAVLMESVTLGGASGNTAAGDITEVNSYIFNEAFALATTSYPADKSGNGGGGKGKF